MECVQIDLNNVCRTCKNESSQMNSLYHRDSENGKKTLRLDEMLMACASVQVNNEDGLPKSICGSCFVHLKNAYSFKEQCEKTDLFLRDHLKNLKKESIKEEITDLEFTSNFISEVKSPLKDITQINDDHGIENKKDNSESHLEKSRKKDVDYVQVVDSDIAIYECRTCSKVFYTLEDLRNHKPIHTNNIVEHYLKMDIEDNTITFSDQSDGGGGGGGGDLVIVEETLKPEVKTLENNDQAKVDEIVQRGNEISAEEDPLDMSEKTKEKELEVDNGDAYDSDTSTNSGYLSTKQPPSKMKRDRGRHRKHPTSLKPTDRSRGPPPLVKLKTKPPRNEISNFPCSECKEVFTNMSSLEKHALQHDGLRIHECDSCNKKFSRWNNLKEHKLSHMEVKPFPCMTCRKTFARRDRLERHMKVHLSAKVHVCDLCRAVFYRLGNLAKHKALKHNISDKVKREKKNFLCSECGQRFIRNQYLTIHMRRHRGEKPFKCKYCGKGFPCTTDLIAHERYHTGEKTHVCVICGKAFGRAYDLTVHMRKHTGEKPYRCTYCDARFSQCSDLKCHIRKHTGERFQCELCSRAFLTGYLLTQHKRKVHGLKISSIRIQPINKLKPDDPPPLTVSLPAPVVVSKPTVSDPLQSQQESKLKQEQKSDM